MRSVWRFPWARPFRTSRLLSLTGFPFPPPPLLPSPLFPFPPNPISTHTAIAGSTSNNTRAPGALNGLPVASAIEQVASYLGALAPDEKIDTRLHVLLTGQNNIRSNPVATGADATEDIVYAVGKLTDAGQWSLQSFSLTTRSSIC